MFRILLGFLISSVGFAQFLPFPVATVQANPTYCYGVIINHLKVAATETNYPSMFRTAVGTVNTVTTAVTLATGDQFPDYYSNGLPIGINGVTYLISSRTSGTALVLQSSAGTQTGVAYNSTPFLATIANGGKVQNASGFDIGFYSNSDCSTKLDWEIESWTNTGIGVWWYRVPSLSSSVDTTVYLGYGNASTTTNQSNATGVWNSNFKGVWHLTSTAESTSSGFTLTAVNSPTTGTGQVGGDYVFVKASTQYLTTANAPVTAFPYTIQAWAKLADTSFSINDSRIIASVAKPSDLNNFFIDYFDAAGSITEIRAINETGGGARQYIQGETFDTNWHLLTASWTDASTCTLYQDGVFQTSTGVGAAQTPAGMTDTFIGLLIFNTSTLYGAFGGQIDEVRIRNDAQTANTTTTDYNLMFSPFTFWSTLAQ